MADENTTEPTSALEAMDAALSDTLLDTSTDTGDGEDSSEALGDAGSDDEGAEGDAAGEGEESDEAAAAAGRERNPDGTFKKPETKPEGEQKPTDGKKPDDKKAPDHVNDPIPKDLNPKTQERIRSLVTTAKEVTAERDQIKQDFDYMVQGVQATGATPQQYGETLSWLQLFNSDKPEDKEKALELVETVADRLATLLGKERTVGNPLEQHEDLRNAVAQGQITQKYALEMARVRNRDGFQRQLSQSASQEQQQQRQFEQEQTQARNELNTLEATLKATDPQYAAKKDMLVPILRPIFATLPPSAWKAKFEEAYRAIKLAGPVGNAKPKVPDNQPLRAHKSGVGSGGGKTAPSSGLDVINSALAEMSGR